MHEPREHGRRRERHWCLLLVLALFLAGAGLSHADPPRVFANPADSPVDPGFAHMLPAGQAEHALHLYIDAGTDVGRGTPCVDSDGDHLCGHRIVLEGLGGTELQAFFPETGLDGWELVGSDRLIALWSDPAAPRLGPQRIGELRVIPGSPPGALRLAGGGAVVGNLSWTPFEAEDLAVPEPSFGSMAICGALALILMRRGRRPRLLYFFSAFLLASFLFAPAAHAWDPFATKSSLFRQMGAGRLHHCGVLESGDLRCWGTDSFGSVNAAPTGAYRRVDVGDDTNCALSVDGDLDCWGFDDGPIGLTVPPVLPAGLEYVSVSIGWLHACAVRSDQSVVCWGIDIYGESSPPAGLRATDVAAGREHSCARQTNGTAVCWGRNNFGQSVLPPALADKRYEHILAGDHHNCALRPDGRVDCWGDPTFAKTSPPATIFESLSVGNEHACAVRPDGMAECWGRDDGGETIPLAIPFLSVYAGDDSTCGRRSDGSVLCWGDPLAGAVHPSTTSLHHVAAGGNHSCALGFDLRTECFGAFGLGQLNIPPPPLTLIDAGTNHTCGIGGNSIFCWGDDSLGQSSPPFVIALNRLRVSAGGNASCMIYSSLLQPTTPLACWGNSSFDQDQPPSGSFDEVSVGRRHACAISDTGALACWGDPTSTNGKTNPPPGVFRYVSSGGEHSCAIDELGRVRCWGDNAHGQSERQEAIFSAVAAGGQHTCGILLSGRIRCWGNPVDGRTSPPAGLFETISADSGHTCAARVGGGIACWGTASSGRTRPYPDMDFDGLENGVDNCPFDSNPDQTDGDGDGAGDTCDVCAAFPDIDQLDHDGDGVGDRCDASPRVELEPGTIGATDASYSLFLQCGSSAILTMQPEILIPGYDPISGTPTVAFGDGCNPSDCLGANPAKLGSTIDLAASSVFFHPTASAGREDALQLDMVGSGQLCLAGERVFIGILRIDGISDFGVHPHTSSPNIDASPIDTFGNPTNPPKPSHAWGPTNADTQVLMEYLGDNSYRVGILSEIDIYRATIGIRIPIGGTMTNVVIGDPTAPIWIGGSSSVGPGAPFPLRTDTRYFQFLGGAPSGGLPNPRLNEAGDMSPRTLVTFSIDGGGPTPAVLESEGVEEAFPESAFLASAGGPVGLDEVGHEFFTSGNDTDSDGVSDELDNCAFAANFEQDDDGGFDSPGIQNGRGNACECGDTTDDGSVTLANDPAGMIDVLLERASAPANAEALCSVTAGIECDAADLVGLGLAFEGIVPGIQNTCGAAAGEGLFNP